MLRRSSPVVGCANTSAGYASQLRLKHREGFTTRRPNCCRGAAPCSASATGRAEAANEQPSTSGRALAPEAILPPPPPLHGKGPRKSWNALALAFLGDGVWEMYARRRFFYPPTRMADYYASVVGQVRAEAQEGAFRALVEGTFLSSDERDVLRWGRNATGTTPKRVAGGGIKKETYRAATAVETLAGYLYLTDPGRLHQVMAHLGMEPFDPAAAGGAGGGVSDANAGELAVER